MTEQIESIHAVDVHAHVGKHPPDDRPFIAEWCSGYGEKVVRRAELARTWLSFVSPLKGLMPRFGGDPLAGNEEAVRIVSETPGLRQWVIVDPLKPDTYGQAAEMLKNPLCIGIKIHPEEHGYPIKTYGAKIFEYVAEQSQGKGIVVLSHSGEANSLPEDFVPFANQYPNVKIILGHLGFGYDDDMTHQVRAIQACQKDNLFTDTSSFRMVTPNLIEWSVNEIGDERILYGTDSPLYFAPAHRARIDHAEIEDKEKRNILRDNAMKLFDLKEEE